MALYLHRLFSAVASRIELQREDGQTFVEYTLILVLVALVLAGATFTGLTGAITTAIGNVAAAL